MAPVLSQPTGFFSLPFELRQEIYRYLLLESLPVDLEFVRHVPYRLRETFPHGLRRDSVSRVSKQISEEALDVLYGENTFVIRLHSSSGGQNVLRRFSPSNRLRIRRVELWARPPLGSTYVLGRLLSRESQVWIPVLGNLTKMCILAQQPLKSQTIGTASPEDTMDEWILCLKPVLQFFNQHVNEGLVIELDDDDKEETRDLADQCLTRVGYRKVRTQIGDVIFGRGKYLRETDF